MLRDITLGQYFPGESPIHRLDPRTKIIATMIYLLSLFFVNSFAGFGVALIFLAICVKISGVPMKFMLKGLKTIFLIVIFTFLLNVFMTPGTVLWSFGFLRVTREGLYTGVFMVVRLALLIVGSSLLTLATKPISLTDGIEALLRPLQRFGVPAHEVAMMMSIALRFIPTLLDETDKIMKAQMARGADFESGNLLQRAKSLIPLLVPLFISAFRIAVELAMAMEARCYRGGENRTRLHPMAYGKGDRVAAVVLVIYLLILAGLRFIM
ncbi:MAG: energy-coupling factor transporter transmembrane protein EcfT [Firmicutes bacterium]|nr:energy-coupling factor transporter transmembrane protein EcfT [Bacillota bacterium]